MRDTDDDAPAPPRPRPPRLRPRQPPDLGDRPHQRGNTDPRVGRREAVGAADDDPDRAADEFVGSLFQDAGRGVYVPPWAIDVTTTKAELLVVAQLAYWLGARKGGPRQGRPRASIVAGGYYWVAKSYRQLARELSLTRDQVRGAVRSLKARGVLVAVDASCVGGYVRYRISRSGVERLFEPARAERLSREEADDDPGRSE
jgi:hypothetical protein